MRNWRLLLLTGWVGFSVVSCAGGGGGGGEGTLGDLPAGGEPAEGGISEVPNPSQEMVAKSGKSLEQLQRGHEVYMLKCGECHRYMQPTNLDVDEWEDALPKMIKHAGLGAPEEKAVLDYVIGVKKLEG